ncbi:ribosomal maturation YjgA family protein [Streptomyces sp. NPDC002690]
MTRTVRDGRGALAGPAVRTRGVAAACAVLTVVGALAVRAVSDGDPGKYAGDALYTVLIHALVVLVAPRVRPAFAAGVALAFSCAVEVAQLTGVPAGLSARSEVFRLVLGSTFNAPDLLWYAVGAAFSWGVYRSVRRWAVRRWAVATAAGRSAQASRRVRPSDS